MKKKLCAILAAILLFTTFETPAIAASDNIYDAPYWVTLPSQMAPNKEVPSFSSLDGGLLKFTDTSGKNGYMDANGRVVVAPGRYAATENFHNGYAPVSKANAWGFIDARGREITPLKYKHIYGWHNFEEGLAIVTDANTGKKGFINTAGNVVVPLKYDYAAKFSNGLACVGMVNYPKSAQYKIVCNTPEEPNEIFDIGFIDKTGKLVIPMIYEWNDNYSSCKFDNGIAPVMRQEGGYPYISYVNTSGKLLQPLIYRMTALPQTNEGGYVFFDGWSDADVRKACLMDESGKVWLDFSNSDYDNGIAGVNGMLVMRIRDSKTGGVRCDVYDRTGNLILKYNGENVGVDKGFIKCMDKIDYKTLNTTYKYYNPKTGKLMPNYIEASNDANLSGIKTTVYVTNKSKIKKENSFLIMCMGNKDNIVGYGIMANNVYHKPSSWALPLLKEAKNKDFYDGSFLFDYQKNINRIDLARVAMKLYDELGGKAVSVTKSPFSDTADKNVLSANALGFMGAANGNSFLPFDYTTSGDVAAVLTRVMNYINKTKNTDAVAYLVKSKAISGINDLNAPMTRETVYTIAYRLAKNSAKWEERCDGVLPRGTYYITMANTDGENGFMIYSGNVVKGTIPTSHKLGSKPKEISKFIFKPVGDYYQIICSHSGMALQMYSNTQGSNIMQSPVSNSSKQLFEYSIGDDGTERLSDPESGLYVTLSQNKIEDGKMILWPKLVSNGQKLSIIPVD